MSEFNLQQTCAPYFFSWFNNKLNISIAVFVGSAGTRVCHNCQLSDFKESCRLTIHLKLKIITDKVLEAAPPFKRIISLILVMIPFW